MFDDAGLWSLFASAFVSATLFPGGSEVMLGVLAVQGTHNPWLLLTLATTGNTLGALTTWLMGFLVARRLPIEAQLTAKHRQALTRVRHWGSPAMLLSWLPVIGDPLCFAAGFLRLPFAASLAFIMLGKAARYGVILAALT